MNEGTFKLNDFFWMMVKSVLVGLGIYFIFSGIVVLIMWFTDVPEGLITYLSAGCLGIGCFASGLKLGSCTGRKGIIMGFVSALLLIAIVWCGGVFLTQGGLWKSFSVVKIVAVVISGILGGMVGVNTAR